MGTEDGFCSGIDAEELLQIIAEGGHEGLVDYCVAYQRLTRALHSARCVAAVHGVCLGLGLEMALACTKVVADAGTRIGMDYARYGLMPIAGGSIRLRLIGQSEGAKRLADLAHILASGKCAGNAYEAQRLGLLPKAGEIVANRQKLLDTAMRYLPFLPVREEQEWAAIAGPLAGMIDQIKSGAKQRGEISQHGELLIEKAKALMTKPTSLSSAQNLETETFLDLACRALSQARMRYTISSGKALNN
jgi:enoyl-CoA hydratase/carnithine racemase